MVRGRLAVAITHHDHVVAGSNAYRNVFPRTHDAGRSMVTVRIDLPSRDQEGEAAP